MIKECLTAGFIFINLWSFAQTNITLTFTALNEAQIYKWTVFILKTYR